MSRAAPSCPAARLSGFYAAILLAAGIQLPFWPVRLAGRGLTATEIGIVSRGSPLLSAAELCGAIALRRAAAE